MLLFFTPYLTWSFWWLRSQNRGFEFNVWFLLKTKYSLQLTVFLGKSDLPQVKRYTIKYAWQVDKLLKTSTSGQKENASTFSRSTKCPKNQDRRNQESVRMSRHRPISWQKPLIPSPQTSAQHQPTQECAPNGTWNRPTYGKCYLQHRSITMELP